MIPHNFPNDDRPGAPYLWLAGSVVVSLAALYAATANDDLGGGLTIALFAVALYVEAVSLKWKQTRKKYQQ